MYENASLIINRMIKQNRNSTIGDYLRILEQLKVPQDLKKVLETKPPYRIEFKYGTAI